ncbi:MAG: hypothetical protein HN348_10260 [Proteobacteria bacterium]|nr:hypothetical protein [Pseudomonadota bacterium]
MVDKRNYDSNGIQVTKESDYHNNGYLTTYTYDTDGNLLTKEWGDIAAGTVAYRITYDADGNRTATARWTSELPIPTTVRK